MAGIKDPKDRAVCHMLLIMGYESKRIANLFDCDTGRISEERNSISTYIPKKDQTDGAKNN